MKRILPFLISFICIASGAFAQPATFGIPVSIGRNNCGSSGSDSVYFFNYAGSNLSRATYPNAYRPRIKIGPASTTDRWSIFAASISYNPKDQKLYYLWTDYSHVITRTGAFPTPANTYTYIWRWRPDTTFTAGATTAANFVDTLRSFPYDIGGVAFDNSGIGWTLEFPPAPCRRAFFRPIDFAANIYNPADTLDFTTGPGGIGDTLWNPGSGDITMLPSGRIYYNFDNKLYTPDYTNYGGPTRHIKSTYIDTTRRPAGSSALVGLAFADGDIVASYATGCIYRRLNPVTGDTNYVSYTYAAGKGVYSVDMTQINSGIGAAKKLVSVTATATPNQYDVVYDVFVKNFGTVPVTNVQVTDNIGLINGTGNVVSASAVFASNPAGLVLNPLYNGTTVTNLLLGTGTLPNYPASNNNFTIRITCRLNGIQSGVVYNNRAIATGTGFNSTALKDSSTNGNNPDLNQNDKPDDIGESQPTPFVIVLASTAAPCTVLGNVLYTQDFGNGTGLKAAIPNTPNTASTTFTGTTTAPLPVDRFSITNNAVAGDGANWISLTDHTGGANGNMMVVNADAAANIFYRDTLPVVCPGQQYAVTLWAAFIGNTNYQTTCNGLGGFKYPKFLINIRDLGTGLVITQTITADITTTGWTQYGMKFGLPAGYSNLILEIINAGPGGCGNDVAIDDIQFGSCSAAPTVNINGVVAGCLGSATTFTSALSDPTAISGTVVYQWQIASVLAGPYTNIAGATSANYTIPAIAAADTGKYYRVIVAASGNIGIAGCQYISPAFKLTGKSPSVAAVTATKNKNNICPGISVILGITGGTLGTNASWKWYTGSAGGTLVGTGSTLTVTPSVTTTYYVRAEGDCNTSTDQSVTVFISCNIDKDKDGIPDFVESNMAAAFADANANGIINAYDNTYAGFVDNTNDYINDNFQADGDSDNDGVPNYLDTTFPGRVDSNADGVDDRFDTDKDGKVNMFDLDSDNDGIPDVVEAYGVDVNGDGLIDNYTDTDNDGLSQNVDINNSGASNTGLGLNNPDFDSDGIPNFLDLDSDNDGIPDVVESGGPDVNNDAKIDGFVDVNADGLHDGYINATGLLKTGADITGDGRADSYPNKNLDNDFRPNAYDMDSDADGIVDVIEAGLPDANLNGIVDGTVGTNGWSGTVSAMATLNLRNSDVSGNPDYLDIDSDNDGIPDNIEAQSTGGYKLPAVADADGDGLATVYDNVVGFGGSGIFVWDQDGDTIPDYRDLDTDADGQPDINEGNDFNLNGLSDDLVTLTGLDTDGDGLDNRFDSLNSTINIKGTSYLMGTGGTLTGDPTPGSRCTVQQKTVGQPNRDWRFVGVVLPVQFINFNGIPQNAQVLLNWTILATKEVDRFEIERSIDNIVYTTAGTVNDIVKLNEEERFSYKDDINGIASEVMYYRLKVIGKAGEIKYSNLLMVRLSPVKTTVSIMPNPVNDVAVVKFFAAKESVITLRLIDNLGKIVLLQKQKAFKGNNALQLTGLGKYSPGVYSLQLWMNDEIVTMKLLLE